MKKLSVLLVAVLLCSCGFGGCKTQEIQSEASTTDFRSEYEDKAHSALDEYEYSLPAEDASSDASDFSDIPSTEEGDDSQADESDTNEESNSPEANVFLVTADIAYEDGTAATLVCTAEGDIDLYYDNGTEFTDMEEKADCRQMGEKLIATCRKYVSEAEKVTEFPFPESGNTYVYIKTPDGVFRICYDNTEIRWDSKGDIEICIYNAIITITAYAAE